MKLLSTTALIAALSAGTAIAAIDTNALVADYRAQGYTSIEVRTGPTQTRVEAIRGTEKVEVIYDRETGGVLKSETGVVEAGDDSRPGVSIRDRERDFVGGGRLGDHAEDNSVDESDDAPDDSHDLADDSDDSSDDSDEANDGSSDDSGDDASDDSGDSGDESDDGADSDGGDDGHGGGGQGRGGDAD